jgi:hypothetical protein
MDDTEEMARLPRFSNQKKELEMYDFSHPLQQETEVL